MQKTPKFVVGVIGIIRKVDNILLMRRALTKSTNPGKWESVSGKVEFKEHPPMPLCIEKLKKNRD